MIVARHDKPYKHLWHWWCQACQRRGQWHPSEAAARHEADRHMCLPTPGKEAA